MKKILSVICSISIVLATISCTIGYSVAANSKSTVTKIFDFSSENQVLAIQGTGAGITNGALKLNVPWGNNSSRAKLDYMLEEGKTYSVSFETSISYPSGKGNSYTVFTLNTASATDVSWTMLYSNYDRSVSPAAWDAHERKEFRPNTILYDMSATNSTTKSNYEFEFTVSNLPEDHKYLGIVFQSSSDSTSILIDNFVITDISNKDAEPTVASAKYTFDEVTTDYWGYSAPNSTTNAVLEDGGNGGKSLAISYKLYDSILITFDYVLKNNTKYFISYQYKGSDWVGALNANSCKIACGRKGTTDFVGLEPFTVESGWPISHVEWKTRTVMLETGENTVNGSTNRLAFKLGFGIAGKLYIDNITITEVKTTDSYSNDFSEELTENDLFNYSAQTNIEVVADPENSSNKVLKLHKDENKHAPYNLFLPVKLVEGNSYTIEYKYKTDSKKQVGLNQGAKVGILNSNGVEDPKLGNFTQYSTILCGFTSDNYNGTAWPKVPSGSEWINRSYTFIATKEMLENSSCCLGITLQLYGSDPVDELNVFLDDVKVINNGEVLKKKVYVNGHETEISNTLGKNIKLPLTSMPGYVYDGIYSDIEYNNLIGTIGDEIMWADDGAVYFEKWSLMPDAEYTFEDTSDVNDTFMAIAVPAASASGGKDNTKASISVVSDSEDNNCLKITTKSYIKMVVNFNYEFAAGENYRITYKLKRGDTGVISRSGVYVGKAAVTDKLEDSLKSYKYSADAAELLGDNLSPLYEYAALDQWNVDKSLPTDRWYTHTAVLSPENVDNDTKYLTFSIEVDPVDTEKYADIYIDDIKIENIDISTVKFYANGEAIFVTEDIGIKVNMPASNGKYGYEFAGIYEDAEYKNRVSLTKNDELIWPDTDKIYYEKWVKSSKQQSSIGTATNFDFESSDKTHLSIGLSEKSGAEVITESGNGGICLKIKAGDNGSAAVNFDFQFESFAKYRITYDIKGENAIAVQSKNSGSGIYIGKSTQTKDNSSAAGLYDGYIGKKLSLLYGVSAVNSTISTDWTTYGWEVSTGYISGDFDKLTMVIHSLSTDGMDPAVYIDNLTIEKIGISDSANQTPNIADYTFDSDDKGYYNVASVNGKAQIVKEETRSSLKLTSNGKNGVAVNFDYLLSSNSTYKISYDIKGKNIEKISKESGIWVGSSLTATNIKDISDELYKRLADFGDGITEDWQHKELIFSTSNDATVRDYKYLSLMLSTDSNVEIMIDNIHIEKIATNENATFTFEDKSNFSDTYLDYAIENIQKQGAVFVENGIDGNKYLKINSKNSKKVLVSFPFDLESNTKYRISYRIKGNTQIQQGNALSGIYLGKSSGFVIDEDAMVDDISQYFGQRLVNLYGDSSGNSISLPTDWYKQSYTFTTGNISSDINKFGILICQNKLGHNAVYIDDIIIEKIYDISFVTDNGEITVEKITDALGAVYSMDWLSVAGYKVEGVYTDSSYGEKYTDDCFKVKNHTQTYYVKYKKADDDSAVFKFQNKGDILVKNKGFSVQKDPTDSANMALAIKNTSHSSAVLPFELEKGKKYALTFKYKSSGEFTRVNFGIATGANDTDKPVESYYDGDTHITTEKTRLYNVFGCDEHNMTSYTSNSAPYDKWLSRTLYFTADEVDRTYKYLTLTAYVPEIRGDSIDGDVFYIDDVSIEKVEASIEFSASCQGSKIDVLPIYANIGDTITLPTELTSPFVAEGWYYDKDFKKEVGLELKVSKKSTILYAKVAMNKTTVIDFEDYSDASFSYAKWLSAAGGIAKDPEDVNNNVYKVNSRDWAFVSTNLDYQLIPERVYEFKIRYRSYGEGCIRSKVVAALVPAALKRVENGYGLLDNKNNTAQETSAIMNYAIDKNFDNGWTEATFLFGTGTNGPQINDTIKYLSMYIKDKSASHVCFLFDDITITDLGVYDPSFFPVKESSDWVIPENDYSIWNDWKSWEISDIVMQENIIVPDYIEPELELEDEDEKTKPLRKKKVVVFSESNYSWIIIVAVCVVVVSAISIFLIIFIKKKKRKIE